MSMDHLEEEKLQRYFDGELPEGEAEELRSLVEGSEEAREQLARLDRLRSLIVLAATDVAADLPSEDLFSKVRAGIEEQQRRGYGGPFAVLDGEGRGQPTHIEGWKIGLSAGLGLAVAAAVLLFVLGTQTELPVAGTGETQIEEVAFTTIEGPQGSEVEEVDFGTNIGTVFEVEGEAGEPIAVVWINDDLPDQVTQ
jgi:anti-sigma factor RsiW